MVLGESKPWLLRGNLKMPRSFREPYAAARSETLCGATYLIQFIRCQRAYTFSQMSQPATSPFEGLADLLRRNYSTGFANMQLMIAPRTAHKQQN
jgi:hypothetical protein